MWRKKPIIYFMLSRVCYFHQRLRESEEKYRLCTCSFRDPSTLKCLNVTQFKTKGASFALQFFLPSCSKQSASYENHHNTSSVLSAPKTGYSTAPQYNKSFTPFYTCNRVFGCIGVFLCFTFDVFFLIGKVYLTLGYNFFIFHKFVSDKLFF